VLALLLPVHPGPSSSSVLVQRQPGPVQLHLEGFTLRHWQHPFARLRPDKALTNSIEIALISTAIATALGTFMALALVRYGFRGRSFVDMLVFLPLATPGGRARRRRAGAVPDGDVQHRLHHDRDRPRHVHVSYVVVTVKARLEGMDRHIEEAAMDLGRPSGRRSARSRCR
jgi:spermidine/putrescine transport system permease protein